MTNVIYVGNYPDTFTEDDLMEVFQDFQGLVLLRFIKHYRKCYSFILCEDQEQVLDIVLTLNETEVGGRVLIVRASDDEFQEFIEESDDDEDDLVSEASEYRGGRREYYNNSPDFTTYRQPRNPSRLIPTTAPNANDNYSNVKPDTAQSHGYKKEFQPKCETPDFDTASCASYATSHKGRKSPGSTTSCFSKYDRRGERFSFISVMNFPNNTTTEELEELFADYNPYKIIIRCSKAEKGQPTEALICFFKAKNAFDSLLNFDNTVYNGRVLVVTESDDISGVTDLLKVHNIN